MIHVGVTAPGVEEAVSNRECNEPRIVSKILIRQESLPDADASAGTARINVASFVKLCTRDDETRVTAVSQNSSYRLVRRFALDKMRTSANDSEKIGIAAKLEIKKFCKIFWKVKIKKFNNHTYAVLKYCQLNN